MLAPILGAARVEARDGGLYFVAHEHGGLRCRFAERLTAEAATAATEAEAGPATLAVDCVWDDVSMGASTFTIELAGRRAGAAPSPARRVRVAALRFRVRPEFYDPLEYSFTRRR